MAPSILNTLGFGGPSILTTKPTDQKTPIRALPASWYSSPEMYELEKRAIFSRRWMLMTHQNRLPHAGDWLKFEVAGFELIIARDRKAKINAFHNICRHRAFPVVQGQQGNAKIFACRYHGWSYGIDGKLAKAPKYDELAGFDKTKNNMFPIHVHVDGNGFVWVNLDSKETPEVSWEDDFVGSDMQERFKAYNFDDYVFDHEYKMDGPYNWKILADNFNECYHCPTTHPDVATLADIETHDIEAKSGWIRHMSGLTEEQKKAGLGFASSYYFPNASAGVFPAFLMLQRFSPIGPSSSSMHYQIFRNKHSTEADFQLINVMYKRIMSEDKALCEAAQRNLNAGIFISGELHPRLEKGPLYFQKVAREAIYEHVKREKEAKGEIWPARQQLPESAMVSKEDIEVCKSLACHSTPEGLAW